jgi:GWxTD domain-containing protein
MIPLKEFEASAAHSIFINVRFRQKTPTVMTVSTLRPVPLAIALLAITWILPVGPIGAQVADRQDLFAEARGFYEEGQLQPALERLQRIVSEEPALMSNEGSAAFWYARVLEASGPENAQRARIEGIERLNVAGRFDPRLVDAAVSALDLESDPPPVLVEAYTELLKRAGATPGDTLVDRHATYSALLLDDSTRSRVILAEPRSRGALPVFQGGAGEVLVRWWRGQDPLPASVRNERFEHHVIRVATALRSYGDTTRAVGLDDRGLVYIRLGEPRFVRSVSFDDARFFLDVVRFGVSVGPSDFPVNEVWLYSHIHSAVYYIFAQDHRRRYREIRASDLIPRRLQNASSASERSQNMAVSSVAAMRHVYRALALLHPDFGPLYSQIDDYAMWQEERRLARMAGGPLEVGEVEYRVGAGATSVPVYVNRMRAIDPPHEFVSSSMSHAQLTDQEAYMSRERAEPNQFFQAHDAMGVDPLAVSARASRFLGDDGRSTVLIDWSPAPSALELGARRLSELEALGFDRHTDLVVEAVAVATDETHTEMARQADVVAIMTTEAPNGVLIPRTLSLPLASGTSRIGLQFDRYVAAIRPGPPPLIARGPRVQVGVEGFEGTMPIASSGMAMSDIRPFFSELPPEDVVGLADPLDRAFPFPHGFAPSRGSLILYFEAYGLQFGADDETHYAIEYEVARREPGTAFQRILGRSRRDVTAARTEHRGTTARTEEIIVLDPSEWSDGAEIRLTIRVTDLHAHRTTERVLVFQS